MKAKKYITCDDIIQVVVSQRFSTPVKAAPLDVYRAARSVNPSPYMFLLELDGFSLVGASPEIHVRCEDNKVEIRPIAGTRRRGKTPAEDAALERSEEHTSELQSPCNLVCRLLLEKKKKDN